MTRSGNGDAGLRGHSSPACVELSIDGRVALLRLNRSESGNSISARMVAELWEMFDEAEAKCSVLVLEGGHEVFCVGADLSEYSSSEDAPDDPGSLYRLWARMATGPLLTVAHIRGRVSRIRCSLRHRHLQCRSDLCSLGALVRALPRDGPPISD